MKVGEKANVRLSSTEGYGDFDPKMTMEVPREELAHIEIVEGAFLQLDLGEQKKVVKIASISDSHVKLDGNHPLAGVELDFDIELVSDRPATPEELSHGHVHGVDGHHHH